MKVWLIKTGEPIAANNPNERPHRMGMLADFLLSKGHEVVWWMSTVDHLRKELIYKQDKVLQINDAYKLYFLHGPLYKKNVSLMRLLNHRIVANGFLKASEAEEKPDVIVCSFPTIDLANAAVKYGKENSVPVILDVRDLWPDVFLAAMPSSFSRIGRFLLTPYYRMAKSCLRNTDYLTAVSPGYLRWASMLSHRQSNSKDAFFPLAYEQTIHHTPKEEDLKILSEKYSIDSSKIIVWYLGTFGRSYDLTTVIEAAKEIQTQGNNKVQFVISGDGDRAAQYKESAKGLYNLIFTGWIDKVEIDGLMHIVDIGIMPYAKNAKQGLPNKVFEYMSAGLPILSSLQSETMDILEEEKIGLTYQPGSKDSFMEQLLRLVDDENLRNSMHLNALKAFDNYNAELVYGRMVDYICEAGGKS